MTCIAQSHFSDMIFVGFAAGACRTSLQQQSCANLHTKLHAQRSSRPERLWRPFCSKIKARTSDGRFMAAACAMLSETGAALLCHLVIVQRAACRWSRETLAASSLYTP